MAATLQAAFAAAAESTHEFSTGFMSFPLHSLQGSLHRKLALLLAQEPAAGTRTRVMELLPYRLTRTLASASSGGSPSSSITLGCCRT